MDILAEKIKMDAGRIEMAYNKKQGKLELKIGTYIKGVMAPDGEEPDVSPLWFPIYGSLIEKLR